MKFKGGRIPYGFHVLNGELVFNTGDCGHILVHLMKAHQMGNSYRAIAKSLNAQDVEGPGNLRWNYGSVARVIAQGKKYSHLIPFEYAIF